VLVQLGAGRLGWAVGGTGGFKGQVGKAQASGVGQGVVAAECAVVKWHMLQKGNKSLRFKWAELRVVLEAMCINV